MKRFLAAAAALLMASCASYDGHSLAPGASAEQVRAVMGTPTSAWRDGAGEVLEYARGPEGSHTYFVRLDGAGRMVGIDQVLNDATFNRIEIGRTTRDDVLHLIGHPASSMTVRGLEWWDYRYQQGGPKMRFNVAFDASGIVRRVERLMDPTEINSDGPSSM